MVKRLPVFIAAVFALLLMMISFTPAPVNAQITRGSFLGTYFNNTNFTAPATASNINYPTGLNFTFAGAPTDGSGNPVPGVNADSWSAVYSNSAISFPQTGNYQFSIVADDFVTVLIDGQQVYNDTNPGPDTNSFTLTLQAGFHAIELRFVEFEQTATLQFQWQLATGTIATSTPAGPVGPVGNVVNVRGLSLRTGPYLGASFIAVLRPEIAYQVLAKNNDEGIFTWYKVQAGERVGWASGRYMTVVNQDQLEEEVTIFQTIEDVPDTGVVAVPRSVMNLRRRPTTRSEILRQIAWGEEGQLLGRTIQGGQNHWFYVRYGDLEGWIFAPFVGWRGDINRVTVY